MDSQAGDPAKDCRQAISLAVDLLEDRKMDPAEYKLIFAENAIRGANFAGPHIWRLIFKRKSLIPDTPDDEVGKGGELLIEVDLTSRKARLSGHGE